jgi:hypothetical protein
MARLYYEDSANRPKLMGGGKQDRRTYLEKVAKLVPAEIVAGYTAINGFIPKIDPQTWHFGFYWGAFGLGVVGTFFYMLWQSEKDKPRWPHIIVSTVAFVVWAYATAGEHLLSAPYYQAPIASIVLVVFTLISGKIPLR